jgi:hypothetical protein
MENFYISRFGCVLGIVGFLLISQLTLTPNANADTWRGTAPICEGSCLPGEQEIRRNKCGDGSCCLTGSKVLCRNSAPTCQALQTNVACKGVLLICDNGFYTQSTNQPNWHSCSKHACGACLGWWSDWKEPAKGTAEGVVSILSVPSLPRNQNKTLPNLPYGPDTCKQGFVWREAIQKDHVCVRPDSRNQAANDNRNAASRREPSGGRYGPATCKQGFVWREVVPSDRVCVTPQIRERTKSENSQFEVNRARGSLW